MIMEFLEISLSSLIGEGLGGRLRKRTGNSLETAETQRMQENKKI